MFDRTNIRWPLEVVVRPVFNIEPADLGQLVTDISDAHAHFMAMLDSDSAEVLVGGCDERQLGDNLDLLRDKIPGKVNVDTPKVGYRETVGKPVEIDYTHRKTTGGRRQFARVKIIVEPLADISGFEFENRIEGGTVPKKYFASVEKGILAQRGRGPIEGMPVLGSKVSLVDGAFHEADSSAMAFETAARAAFREAVENAAPVVVEPIIKVEVVCPNDCVIDVVGDINTRVGAVSGVDSADNIATISALVPVARMFGFANTLADLANDRGSYSVQFSHFERVSLPGDDPLWPEPVSAALRA